MNNDTDEKQMPVSSVIGIKSALFCTDLCKCCQQWTHQPFVSAGGWKRSWFCSAGFVPRSPWVGVSSGSRWPCSWGCVWLSVFSHSSVTTTTDARTRKPETTREARRRYKDLQMKWKNQRTAEQRRPSCGCQFTISPHSDSLESTTLTLEGRRCFGRLQILCRFW